MPFLRQSTTQTILFGPCLDKTDGVTEETALTLAQADMRLSKDGAAFAQKSAAGNATHDSDGWYNTSLSTTDTATVGELILNVHQPANMLPVWMRFFVVEEEVYDDLFAASAVGYLKPVTGGNDLDVTATGAAGIDWGNIENKTTVNDLTQTDIQLVDTCTTNTDMVGTDSALLASSAPTNFGDLSITVTTGLVDITQAAADKVWGTAARILTASTNFNDLSAAQVNTEVDTALTDLQLDKLLTAAVVGANVTDNSVFAKLVSSAATADWDTFVNTTDSMQAVRDVAPHGTAMRGTDSALLASSAPTNFSDLSITVTTGLVDITQTAADKAWSTATRVLTAAGIPSGGIAAAELNNIADALLDRRLDLGTDTGGNTTTSRTWRQALRTMRNRVAIAGGTMTVYEEDDVTSDFTAAVTTSATDPIQELNPA